MSQRRRNNRSGGAAGSDSNSRGNRGRRRAGRAPHNSGRPDQRADAEAGGTFHNFFVPSTVPRFPRGGGRGRYRRRPQNGPTRLPYANSADFVPLETYIDSNLPSEGEDSDMVPVAVDDMLSDNNDFVPSFLLRTIADPTTKNPTQNAAAVETRGTKAEAPVEKKEADSPRTNLITTLTQKIMISEAIRGECSDDSNSNVSDSGDEDSSSEPEVNGRRHFVPAGKDVVDLYENLQGIPLNMSEVDFNPEQQTASIKPPTPVASSSTPVDLDGISEAESTRSISLAKKKKKKRRPKKKKDPNSLSWTDFAPLQDEIEQGLSQDFDDLDTIHSNEPTQDQFVTVARRNGKSPLRLNLADEDLQEQLEAVWDQNRAQKEQRKLQKMESHETAAIAATSSIHIPNHYPRAEAIFKDCLAEFIISTDKEFVSPFLAKHQRVMLHRLAMRAKLQTTSHGKEGSRFTIVRKSSRKSIDCVSKQEALVLLGSIANKSKRDRPERGASFEKKGSNANLYASTRARNGDVVGADADPIGESNKGHALLLKMGWKKGQPLGTSGTGILEPIKQVVKVSRSGLG